MLNKKHRLNLSLSQNASIFEKKKSFFITSDFFLAYLRPNKDNLRITCLTSKAALSKASSRNFYRRFIYLLAEEQIIDKVFDLNSGFDLVIVLKRHFTEDKNLLRKDFILLAQKIKTRMNLINESLL